MNLLRTPLISAIPQMPLPSAAARAYEDRVLMWARDAAGAHLVARDVPYGADAMQRLNVFAASNTRRDAPVVVFFHGGGWTNGYKEYVSFMAPHVIEAGCVLVAPSYRLAPGAPLPAAVDDCASVLAAVPGLLAEVMGRRVGDTRRIVLAGHSAGAHLAAMLALRPEVLVAAGANPALIAGCFPLSGIFDLHHPDPAAGSLEARVYDMVLGPETDDALMSPLCWAHGSRIPMVLTWGEHDSLRVAHSNRRLASVLTAQGSPCRAFIEPGADHFDTHTRLDDPGHVWYRRLAMLANDGVLPDA